MKKFMVVLVMVAAVGLVAGNADAQARTDNNWINVNATVVGLFDFKINGADELASPGASYTFPASITPGDTVSSNGAFTWTVESAPTRLVDITYQNATVNYTATFTGGTPLGVGALELEMPVTGGATAGFVALTGGTGTLVNDASAGNGANTAAGDINLRLTVPSTASEGTYQFVVELVATGT